MYAQVNIGSIADQAGLIAGDSVIKVNNVDVFNLRHKDAQDVIVRSGNSFDVLVQRGGSTWAPHVTPTGAMPSPQQQYGGTVTKTSLQHYPPPNEQHIGCGYNNSARPFNQNGGGPVKSIVNKQYNTPVGMYSEESIAETLTAQAEVLANGVLGWVNDEKWIFFFSFAKPWTMNWFDFIDLCRVNFKKNEKVYNSAGSEVLKALKESETDPHEPGKTIWRSNNFSAWTFRVCPSRFQSERTICCSLWGFEYKETFLHINQRERTKSNIYTLMQKSNTKKPTKLAEPTYKAPATKHVSAPIDRPAPPSTGGLPPGQNICANCERLIV